MRFLVDESTGPTVSRWLASNGHEVFSVYDEARSITDEEVIKRALSGNWILITNDKDFGEKVYRDKRQHAGIILLRLSDERSLSKIAALQMLLRSYSGRLANNFVVVTETQVRFARLPSA